MLHLNSIVGYASDEKLSERLHRLQHRDGLETLVIEPADAARHRLRRSTDKGTECAIALSRQLKLSDGAVLLLEEQRAIVVRLSRQHWLRLRPVDSVAALALGYHAGNLHWQVRFENTDLLVALNGPEQDYLDRLVELINSGAVLQMGITK